MCIPSFFFAHFPVIPRMTETEATKFLQSLMGVDVRVTLTDTRQVTGSLHCVDSYSNLILHNVQVQLPSHDASAQLLSSAMVNGKHIVSVERLLGDSS